VSFNQQCEYSCDGLHKIFPPEKKPTTGFPRNSCYIDRASKPEEVNWPNPADNATLRVSNQVVTYIQGHASADGRHRTLLPVRIEAFGTPGLVLRHVEMVGFVASPVTACSGSDTGSPPGCNTCGGAVAVTLRSMSDGRHGSFNPIFVANYSIFHSNAALKSGGAISVGTHLSPQGYHYTA
jgi:predicted outer membrane repeat protein